MTSKSEINLQNFYVYNSSFGQKEGEVSVNCLPGRLTIKRVTYLYTKSYNEKWLSHLCTLMDNNISEPMNLETAAFHSRIYPVVQIIFELLQLNIYEWIMFHKCIAVSIPFNIIISSAHTAADTLSKESILETNRMFCCVQWNCMWVESKTNISKTRLPLTKVISKPY